MSDSPYQLIRVYRPPPPFIGEWQALYYCPDPASPQEFVVGIACTQAGKLHAWRLLDEFDKFQCLYGTRLPASALKPYFQRVSEELAKALKTGDPAPDIQRLSHQLRWGTPLYASGDTAGATVDDLFQTAVALIPEAESRARRGFKVRSTDAVRASLNPRLKVLMGMRFERVVNEAGFEQVQDGNTLHKLSINLRAGRRVGTVISAWYSSLDSVVREVLQAEADLTTAQRHFQAREAGLFILRPFDPPGVQPSVVQAIDAFIDDSRWRCSTRGNYFEVDQDEARLAGAIADYF